ncbi:phosphatases II, partial [Guyanagaster necrorhizus]
IEHYSVSIATHPDNASSNRYMDIHPYNRTAVLAGGTRYLNASWILELHGGKWWVATQAPLPDTANAFLTFIMNPITTPVSRHHCRIRTIVQLTRHSEAGRVKAHPYFPSVVGQSAALESGDPGAAPLKVTTLKVEHIREASCIKSTVSVSTMSGIQSHVFQHLLYDAWPDHGVPSPADRSTLLSFLQLVQRVNCEGFDDDPPIVAGCSAGVGRTGAFIALASLLRSHKVLSPTKQPSSPQVLPPSPIGPLPRSVENDPVVKEIDFLREQRPGMVQRDEQVRLIYEML